MDLNLSPSDTDLEGNASPYSTIRSVHPWTNHEVVVEHNSEYQKIPNIMPYWLARLATKSNPHQALEQFLKLNPTAFKGEADPKQKNDFVRLRKY